MAILNYLKKLWARQNTPKPVEYVQEAPERPGVGHPLKEPTTALREMEHEIDLSSHHNLEDYARGLSVSEESIERWVSSGLLMPDEMKVAEKILKIMRNR